MEVKIAVLASGAGSNFKALVEGETEPGVVDILLTDNPNAGALKLAAELGVEARYLYPGKYRTRFGIEEERLWADFLLDRGVQLICLAGLMRIIKGPLLDAYRGRMLNIHPSLLPAFPGLDAQGQAFSYGVKIAGCTVHYVDDGTDTGQIILQKAVPVLESDQRDSLAARILLQEHEIYSKAVKAHCLGRAVYSKVIR
ncbi:MAG: phosphoribosylglycinamide formyltransferase [Candidatus Sabulitectum sp.]|nr:phosphoribosylglycinamide formyltransferase [Candidatus Sabulitectum sp.]